MSNKNDSEKVLNSIFSSGIRCHTQLERNFLTNLFIPQSKYALTNIDDIDLQSNTVQIVKYDKPDLLVIQNNNVIGIEHFQVDESIMEERGSTYQKNYSSIKRDNFKEVRERLLQNNFAFKVTETELSTENLKENIKKIFYKHYCKIDEYNESIKKIIPLFNNEVKYFFFIECNKILPFELITENNDDTISILINDINFLRYICLQKRVLGVFLSYNTGLPNVVTKYFLSNEENLLEYETKNKNSRNMKKQVYESKYIISKFYINR